MIEFNLGELVHYSVGSDTYPCIVTFVSKSKKEVRVSKVKWRVKTTFDGNPMTESLYENDVVIIGKISDDELIFKSRLNGPHKELGRDGRILKKGFLYYRDPHF